MWYVYILRCSDESFYTGITKDIKRRMKDHNIGMGSWYTKSRLPVMLVYKEPFHYKKHALLREEQLKRWSKDKKKFLISGNISKLIELSRSRD